MKRRHGFSLVEMLIAMGATVVLLTVSVGLVHRAMTANTTSRRQELLQHEALRLSRQLRDDLRNAKSAIAADGKIEVVLRGFSGESTLLYTLSEGVVLREHVNESGQRRRETFRFPGSMIEAKQLSNPSRVKLNVTRNGFARDTPPRIVLLVESIVGSRVAIPMHEVAP